MHQLAIGVDNQHKLFKILPPKIQENANHFGKGLDELIQNKIKANERFYGIEISPAANGQDLDYSKFTPQPLFTSITWLLDNNLKCDSLSSAPSVQLGIAVRNCCPVLMHLTCFKLDEVKLREFLSFGFQNILALKGG